ncbi:hypothetical protein R5C80_04700 [Pseudomonas sp. On1]|nr:hypothetical protein [Pseudomonas sp. On1]MDX2310602.1 hypothetical protein [Pseudomonas sp. On1]
MDNAIGSKDALGLSVGVGLSSAQVPALTHDIVWLEAREINGEQVLAPVFYLAHANGRLAPDGALTRGRKSTKGCWLSKIARTRPAEGMRKAGM